MVQLRSRHGLEDHGVEQPQTVYWNLTNAALYEEAVRRHEGLIAEQGPIVFVTGQHTGRSPKDKYLVRNPQSDSEIWWGKINQPMDAERFDRLHRRMLRFLDGKDLFVQDLHASADPRYRLRVRVITEMAYHSMFSRNMFIHPSAEELEDFSPDFTVIDVPTFGSQPGADGTRTEVFINLNFEKRLVLVGGTSYGGEIKKS